MLSSTYPRACQTGTLFIGEGVLVCAVREDQGKLGMGGKFL